MPPPRASGSGAGACAGAARRVNLLIVVIPAQNAALGRQHAKAIMRPLLTSQSEHNYVVRRSRRVQKRKNACQTTSHARCSASSATSMPTATGSSARRRLRLLRTTRPRLSRATLRTRTRTRRWAVLARHPRAPPPRPAAAQAGATRTATRTTGRTATRRRLSTIRTE